MRIIRADVMGMCFGVRDALKVIAAIGEPGEVTIHGELVHNEAVLTGLRGRGFAMVGESERRAMPGTSTVLITAHGISDRERTRLAAGGKRLIDTTCPLVTRAHQAARTLQAQGYHVLVIGRPGHVEVQGIVEDLEHFDLIESEHDVRTYPSSRLGVVCQTTTAERHVEAIRGAIASHNPDAEIRFIDTVCLPTKEHHRSLERLLEQVDAMVVVGGWNSNNTKALVALCRERGVRCAHVREASDLDPAWFVGVEAVGLTAGTSTLDATIEEVHRAIERFSPS